MTATGPVECDDCHRPVVRGPVLWNGEVPYGPRCGRARGLTGGRRVRAKRPERRKVEQPLLFDLDEIETNESEE